MSNTWYFISRGLATGLGKKCFGKSRGEPERMFPHSPKVPLNHRNDDNNRNNDNFDNHNDGDSYMITMI